MINNNLLQGNWTSLPHLPGTYTVQWPPCKRLMPSFCTIDESLWHKCCLSYGKGSCCGHFGEKCCLIHNYGTPTWRDLNRDASGRKEFSCGRTVNSRNNHEEVIVTGGRSESYKTSRTTQILDTVTRTWRAGRRNCIL